MNRVLSVILLLILCMPLFSQTKNAKDDGRKIRVPVVFHVVRTESAPTDAEIIEEIRMLNLDYSAKNDTSMLEIDFKHLVGNPNIEFYLLDTTLQATGLKGIRRINSEQNISFVNPIYCINIVVHDEGNVTTKNSGKKITYVNDEEIAHRDRALTHELGHWLGLYHIWGKIGNCKGAQVLFGNHDDEIDDTPLQWKCTCADDYKPICPPPYKLHYKKHKTMYNNWMDYNGCRCMFTIKQCIVMRNTLITETNLFK